MIIDKNSDSTVGYSTWIKYDGDSKSQTVRQLMDSVNVSEFYDTFPGYRMPDGSYITNVIFDESSNKFTFIFSDGSKVEAVVKSDSSIDLTEYAKKSEVPTKVSQLSNDSRYQTEDEVNSKIKDLIGAAPESLDTLKEIADKLGDQDDAVAALVSQISNKVDKETGKGLSSNDFTNEDKNKLNSIKNYDDSEIRELINSKVDKVDGKDLSDNNFTDEDKSKLDSLSNYDDSNIKSELEKSVKFVDYEGRKVIQLNNYDMISGVTTTGEGATLIMLSKWDKVDVGSPKVPINLNGSSIRPTYNDDKELALLDDMNSLGVYSLGKVGSFNDIPSRLAEKDICTKAENIMITFVVSNSTYGDEGGMCMNVYTQNKVYQTLFWKDTIQKRVLNVSDGIVNSSDFEPYYSVFLGNRSVKGPKLFALTTDSSEDEIKDALTSTIYKKTISSSDLDACVKEGLVIKEEVMNGQVIIGWNGSAYTFTEVGMTSPKSDPSVKNVVINVTPEGKYSVIKNGISSQIVTKSNIGTLLESYATKSWVGEQNFLTEHQDISGLATKEEVSSTYQPKGDYVVSSSISDMLTKTEASSTYQVKDDLATPSKNGVMSSSDKYKLDSLKVISNVSELTNDIGYAISSEVPEYSISKSKSGHNVYSLDELKDGEISKSYRFYSIPNDIQFNSCKFYDELTWLSELGIDSIEVDGESKSVSECTVDQGPYFMITYNDLSKLEISEDGSVTHMELVMVAYSLREALKSNIIPTKVSQLQNDSNFLTSHQDISGLATKSEIADMLTETEASGIYVTKEELEGLVQGIIDKNKQQ